MTPLTQPSYFPSVNTSINKPKFVINSRPYHYYQSKTIKKISSFALPPNNNEPPSSSSDIIPESGDKPAVPDRVRLAFERAKEYKKLKQQNENPLGKSPDNENPLAKSPELISNIFSSGKFPDGVEKEMTKVFTSAMEKAKEYKTDTGMADNIASNDRSEQSQGDVGGGKNEIPDAVRMAFEKAKEYKKNKGSIGGSSSSVGGSNLTGLVGGKSIRVPDESVTRNSDKKEGLKVSSLDFLGLDFGNKKSRRLPAGLVPVEDPFPDDIEVEIIVGDASKFATAPPPETKAVTEVESDDLYKSQNFSEDGEVGEKEMREAFMSAMEKAKEYKTDTGMADSIASIDQSERSGGDAGGGKDDIPDAVRKAFEKAKEYKKNKGAIGGSSSSVGSSNLTGLVGGASINVPDESVTRNSDKKEELKVSSLDFLGLDFGNKKSRRLPAGLVPVEDPFPDDIEVEIIVGDASKFATAPPPETKPVTEEESDDLYKPKVSTWGVFPRPSNISKAFGGGRTIRPGEVLETPEARSAKEARTLELVAAYTGKKKPKIDPKLKADCEKALKDGDALMDRGRLKEALPFFQEVMDKMPFTSELHGLAALQWSICQDSMCRPEKAQSMYDKLKSHPNAQVSRKARHFAFSFQAMDLMKFRGSTISSETIGYQNYFEAFVEDKKIVTSGDTEAEKDSLDQALPYVLFLVSPIFLILLMVATRKGV